MPAADVYQATEATTLIMMATDGGTKAFKGSLRFVITIPESKVLISSYGQAVGHDSLSFQSEASAFLAALRVIFLVV